MGVIITTAGEKLMARLQAEGKPLVIDTFIFAEIPGQDYEADIDPGMALPAESRIRLRYPIPEEYRAYVNPTQVVYSALLGSDVGDWAFNWQGLYCSEHKTLVAVATFPAIEKRAYGADTGQPGNNLTRNFILEFNGAQKLTRINVSADVWQLDFTVRLAGMDERERLSNYDLYGQGYFDGGGWKLVKQGGGYAFLPGLAYVGGIRAALVSALPVPALSKKPCDVWLSVCLKPQGSDRVAEATPLWVDPGASVADVRDDAGIMHYRVRVACVDASGNVTDVRPPEFGDADQPGYIETYLKNNRRYTTCATAAATVAKTAALPGFILKPGAWAVVRFSNTNTAAGATLNIGGTGAKPIQYHGKALTAGTPGAGRAYAFIYTGNAYELVGDVLTLAEGGGLSFDAKGHLYVDFSLVPDDQMRAIVLSMMQQGGGLNVDGKGKLYVDFASMPTDRFESMLQSIRVPIWLTGTTQVYVAPDGVDSAADGRGFSTAKPWATLQYALNYMATNYNLGSYVLYVNVAAGEYGTARSESVQPIVLPAFTNISGTVVIRGAGMDQTVLHGYFVNRNASTNTYHIRDLTIKQDTTSTSLYLYCITLEYEATVQCQRVHFIFDPAEGRTNHEVIRTIQGRLVLGLYNNASNLESACKVTVIPAGCAALFSANGGQLIIQTVVTIDGTCTASLGVLYANGLGRANMRCISGADTQGKISQGNGQISGRRAAAHYNSIIRLPPGNIEDIIAGSETSVTSTGGQIS